jgi:hypothetical protein
MCPSFYVIIANNYIKQKGFTNNSIINRSQTLNMNLVMDINDFNIQSVLLLDSKKNMIMDGNFVRILYSDSFCSINGVYLLLPLSLDTRQDTRQLYVNHNESVFGYGEDYSKQERLKNGTNKSVLKLKTTDLTNANSISKMIDIECLLLDFYKQYVNSEKTPCYSLRDQIHNESLKLYKNQNTYRNNNVFLNKHITNHILKISGIWETSTHFGITYKIIEAT